MNVFLLITIAVTALDIFIIVFAFSLKFFSGEWKWKKKIKYVTVQQDTLIGLTLVFLTNVMLFLMGILFLFYNFYPLKEIVSNLLILIHHPVKNLDFLPSLVFRYLIFQLRLD